MLIASLVFGLAIQDVDPRTTGRRPEPQLTEEQRREAERYSVSEGERAGDAATPDRYICQLERVSGSNLRVRRCATVEDRRRAREIAREIVPGTSGGTSAGR